MNFSSVSITFDLKTPSVLTAVWGMSSLFVQVTVVPAGTVTVCGPKMKLSIFTSVEAWSFAITLGDPANISSAAIAGIAKIAINTFFFFIALFPFLVQLSCSVSFSLELDLGRSTQRSSQQSGTRHDSLKAKELRP